MRLSLQPFLLALLILLSSCAKKVVEAPKKESTGPVQVRAAQVRPRQVQRIVDSVGTFYPYDEVLVSAEIEGKVDQVKVDLGDAVSEGQVLVHVSDEEQRYLLAQNEAQLRMSMEKLGLKTEKERIADVRETPDVRRAAADLTEARQRFNRITNLVNQGIGAKVELDQATARFQSAQAAYDATVNQTRNLIQEVERAKAQLDLQRKKLRDTTVRAPFAAFVKDRQVAVGQYVRPNAPLITLVKTDPIRLRLEVPERMAPWIKNGQTAEILVEAFTDRRFSGKIWRIAPTVDQTKRTFVVEALIANPRGELKPGSYARARVPTDKSERVMVVPARAVNYVLGSNKAYVINQEVIEAREVKVGDRFEGAIEILDGLQEGEQVATGPLAKLDTGVQVRVIGRDEGDPPPADRKASE
ncbi:MAG: efflux RND transporter periplasmic adaptor subunit [Bryobacterales bacterium]|nr:efflux RND transporter periplasmic adaptor subunit [Bryobacterales bacterium]